MKSIEIAIVRYHFFIIGFGITAINKITTKTSESAKYSDPYKLAMLCKFCAYAKFLRLKQIGRKKLVAQS